MSKNIRKEPYIAPYLDTESIPIANITERGVESTIVEAQVDSTLNDANIPLAPDERHLEAEVSPSINTDIPLAPSTRVPEAEVSPLLNAGFNGVPFLEIKQEEFISPVLNNEFEIAEQDAEQRFQMGFTGKLITKGDPITIGQENYSALKNYRYTDWGLEGVGGTAKVNTYEVDSASKAQDLLNGISFRTPYTRTATDWTNTDPLYSVSEYIVLNGEDASSNNYIVKYEDDMLNSTGAFPFTVDSSHDTLSMYSTFTGATEQEISVTVGNYQGAWLAKEIETQLNDNATLTGGVITFSVSYSDTTRYFTIDTGSPTADVTLGTGSGENLASKLGFVRYGEIASDTASSITSYQQVYQELYDFSSTTGAGQAVRMAKLPNGHVGFCSDGADVIWGGDISKPSAFIRAGSTSSVSGLDLTHKILQNTSDEYAIIVNEDVYYIGTTRPMRRFYMDVDSTYVNSTASTMTVSYYAGGTTWTACTITDNTNDGTATLAQDGWVNIDSPAIASHKPYYFNGYYLYFYRIAISADGGDEIRLINIYVDMWAQELKDIWDGVDRTALRVSLIDGGSRTDYTLDVAEESFGTHLSTETTMDTSNLASATDGMYVYFAEPIAAIKFKLKGTPNANDTFNIGYKKDDGTFATATKSLSEFDNTENSFISFDLGSPELETRSYNNFGMGYEYWLSPNVNFAGDARIDKITGVPRYPTIDRTLRSKHIFPIQFANRALWCGSRTDGEVNRIDYSVANTVDCYNGDDSSGMFNERSLYIGGREALTGGAVVYTNTVESMDSILLLFKNTETHVLTGYNKDTFASRQISPSIGCPAPLTITSAEVSPREAEGSMQNIVLWLSSSGPMMYIGNTIVPIGEDIADLFDPNEGASSIDLYYANKASAWFDGIYKEWNLVFPIGTYQSQATPNKWMVYDIRRNKWYEKSIASGAIQPIGAFPVVDSRGRQRTYVFGDNGYLLDCESGLTWAKTSGTSAIDNQVTTADFFFTDSIWEQELLKRFELIYATNANGSISANYYADSGTSTTSVSDLPSASSMALTGYRARHMISVMDVIGWCHKFDIITTGCSAAKAKLLGMGLLHQHYRDDTLDTKYMDTIAIDTGSNQLEYTTAGGNDTITLDTGTYTPFELCNEIRAQFNDSATLTDSGAIMCSVYVEGGKVVMDVGDGNTVYFTYANNNASNKVGYSADLGSAQTITAQNYITEQVS